MFVADNSLVSFDFVFFFWRKIERDRNLERKREKYLVVEALDFLEALEEVDKKEKR